MERKIHQLRPEQEVPNHLKAKISPIDRFLIEPLWSGIALVKRFILGLWTFFKVAIFCLGLLALYYIYSFHAGYIDLTILSQGDLKQMSGDLLKPETKKQVKK